MAVEGRTRKAGAVPARPSTGTARRTDPRTTGVLLRVRVGAEHQILQAAMVDDDAITYDKTTGKVVSITLDRDAVRDIDRTASEAFADNDRAEAAAQVSHAMESTEAELPPTAAAALARQESHWRRIECTYGMWDAATVGELSGSRARNRSAYASQLLRRGRALGIVRRGELRFPAFQFTVAGTVYPVIPKVIDLMTRQGWSAESIILWLTSPNGYLPGGAHPADLLADADAVLTAAEAAAASM